MTKLNVAKMILAGACAAAATLLICAAGGPNSVAVAADDGWGTLSGQFVFDGAIPELAPKVKKGDPAVKDAVCAADGVPNDDLIVDPKSKGIANICVYLKKAPKIHPDLKASKEESVTFDQKGCRFIPHILIARTDQVVKVVSDDPVAHNTNVQPIRGTPFNSVIKAGERDGVPVKLTAAESLPTPVKCDLHPWMKAHWLILDHPYAAITDADGKFTIKDLPAGDHEVVVWHEGPGYIERKLKVKITAGKTTDLGVVKVPAAKMKG